MGDFRNAAKRFINHFAVTAKGLARFLEKDLSQPVPEVLNGEVGIAIGKIQYLIKPTILESDLKAPAIVAVLTNGRFLRHGRERSERRGIWVEFVTRASVAEEGRRARSGIAAMLWQAMEM